MVHRRISTVRVRYVPYDGALVINNEKKKNKKKKKKKNTRMVCFSVPYAYGCTVCVYVSHSIKLSIGTGGSISIAYYAQKAMSFIV